MAGKLKYHTYGARIEYIAKISQAKVTGFVLEARPQIYGKNGVRSYYIDETAIVRGTSEDRAAGPADPVVPSCEYDFNPCDTH